MELLQPGQFYHIYNHANGTENVFREDDNYRFFLAKYHKYISPVANTYAYCLMPNHFHFLVKTKSVESMRKSSEFSDENISRAFGNLFNSYTKSYNKLFNRKGSLLNPRFKRKKISNASYLKNVIHYIHYNPIAHGFCDNFWQWPYSSYYSLISEKESKLFREELINLFGSKDAYKLFHNNLPEKEFVVNFD